MGQIENFVPPLSNESPPDVLEKSQAVTEKSVVSPADVPSLSQASHSDGSDLSLIGDKEVTEKGEESPENVTVKEVHYPLSFFVRTFLF